MKITCQSCQSKYNVADEKVQGKIVKIRCRKCGATIVVHGTGGATANGSTPAPEPAAPPVSDAPWHVNLGETDQRTMSLAELMDAYNSGLVTQDTFIWTDGMEDWKPLAEVETVVEALHANAGSPAVTEAPAGFGFDPAATHQPSAIEPPTTFDAPAFVAPYADQAAIAAPAQEAKRAAVRREARGRDLFAGGGGGFAGGEEVQTSAPAMPQGMTPQDDLGKMTGERNENSVLFSLAVLTKNADERAPSQPPPSGSNEDSGLIDLKALAARAESTRPPSMADGGMFASPIGISSPLGASDLGSPFGVGAAPPKSKLPLIIGGVAGGLLLVVLGLVLGAKISAISAAPAASAVAPPATTSAEPVATASAPTAEASASAAPSASVAKPKPVYHAPAGGGVKPVAAGGTATASSGGAAAGATGAGAVTPPPPKKQGSDCGCNGDLMCLMKCSTH